MLSKFNRVIIIGRETYIRLYPNPGFGVKMGSKRVALSLRGGLEVFHKHPRLIWQRTYSLFSRVKRPGSK